MMRSKGFTLRDLLIVIVCVTILVFQLIPCRSRAYEMSTQASCRANLKGVGTAIAMFKGEDKNSKFPLLWTAGNPEADILWTDGYKDLDELKTKLVGREAMMQNVWVIVDKGLVTQDAFGCAADDDYLSRVFKDKAGRHANKVGWRSSAEFSYGMPDLYKSVPVDDPTQPTKVEDPSYLGPHMKGSLVIMADKNPSQNNEPATGVGPDTPHSNHYDGISLLMFSGAVNWTADPESSMIGDDDIYTKRKQNSADPATPADIDDIYILRHPALPDLKE